MNLTGPQGGVVAALSIAVVAGACRAAGRPPSRVPSRNASGGQPSITWLVSFADRAESRMPDGLRRRIDDLSLPPTAGAVVVVWCVVVIVVAVGVAALVGLGSGFVIALVMVFASGAGLVAGNGRAARQVERELPLVLDTIAAGLRSGSSLLRAIDDGRARASGPVRADLDRVLALEAAGAPLATALHQWRDARPVAGVGAAVTALVLAHEIGGAAAAAVDGLAAIRRDALAVADEMIALSTQARASSAVIVVAPLCFAVLTGAADQQSWLFLTSTPSGLACLASGLVLDVVGGLWMARVAKASA